MMLVFLYKYRCLICKKHFDCPDKKPACIRCGSRYTERLLQRGVKKIKKKKRCIGHFIAIGEKKCSTCLHSQTSETTSAVKCTLSTSEVVFNNERRIWICYSFQKKK